jgi:hypothetical protein
MSFTVRVFDALDVPHCAPRVIDLAAVVSIVTVRDAATSGIGRTVNAVNAVPRRNTPCPTIEPEVPTLRTTPRYSSIHGHAVAPVVVVTADDAANADPATPP